MITKFRLFENKEDNEDNPPMVDDYVLCDIRPYTTDEEFIDFIDNNIGKIINFDNDSHYLVKYYDIPKKLDDWYFGIGGVRHLGEEDIVLYAPTKEKLEIKIKANKFNL